MEGYEAYGIYDLNYGRFFRVTKAAGRFLEKLTGEMHFGEYSKSEQDFICKAYNNGIIAYNKTSAKMNHTKLEDVVKNSRPLKFAWFELTSKCNHNCLHCFMGDDLNRFKPYELNEAIKYIDVLNNRGISQLIFSGGEPFLHPEIEQIINYTSKLPINLAILTNGTTDVAYRLGPLLKDENIKVKISILGDEETHDRIVGVDGSFARLIRTCSYYKKLGIHFELTCTVNDLNVKEVNKIKEIADSFGAFIEFSPLYCLGNATKNKSLLLNSTQRNIIEVCKSNKSNINKIDTTNSLKRSMSKSDYEAVDLQEFLTDSHECGQKIIAIQCSGLVSPCLLIRNPDYAIGNINETELHNLLNYEDKSRQDFNSLVKIDTKEKCTNCEAKYVCKGGGCIAASYSVFKDFTHENPYYSKCFYKDYTKACGK
ncbi:radical SAM/SPASM domain-containing protein [Lactobacillus acetotolerans]|uniref:radical SAM/SPASM domain-containing protein n=1 Tax=Lactobacillus acetotolerans TaxID=1600 RepID=UPI00241F3724|nr:radical SAM protein [Lactobacillus acetotolerans]